MFSGLDRPPDCETLEYAWLVESSAGHTVWQAHHATGALRHVCFRKCLRTELCCPIYAFFFEQHWRSFALLECVKDAFF